MPWEGKERAGGRRRERASTEREGEERGETKMSGLYREEPLGEGQPSPWAGEFRVGSRVNS